MWRLLNGFLIFLLGLFVLTALLSPPAFWAVDALWPHAFPFKRVFNRVLMIDALLLLVPLLWYWKITGSGWRDKIGLAADKNGGQSFLRGWLLGVGSLVVLVAFMLLAGGRTWVPELSFGKVLSYLAAGGVVGLLEEVLFRGVFFLAILYLVDGLNHKKKKLPMLVAVLSSLFYSVAHFAKARHIQGDVTWLSGFEVWGTLFQDERGWVSLGMRGCGLFLIGLCLCALVYKYRTIWAAAGLHAGWVFSQKSLEKLTDRVNFNEIEFWKNYLWGYDLVSGLVSFVMLGLILLVFCVNSKKLNPPD
ncbi:MAG: CPBP family intramembrane glutamic endopeptidase [Verrucomicrobiota bacterium]